MNDRLDIGIVGGGMLGSTMALRLADRGHTVTVYEAAPTIGGLAGSAEIGDLRWDRFYHVTLQTDRALLGLLDELGLTGQLEWRATGTGLFHDGELYPVSSAIDYLRLPVLGPVAKARIGMTVLRAASTSDWRSLERVTAAQWLRRWSGDHAYDRFWQPLLRAKLGDRHDRASAAFIWAIIQRLYAARRAGMKQDLFGYVRGGYGTILSAVAEEARVRGVVVRTSTAVEEVSSAGPRVAVTTSHGREVHDRVVVTAPSPIATRVVPGLGDAERRAHESIDYQGVVCVALVLDRPLTGYYVTNITDPGIPFTGVIDMTALVDPAAFGGRGLVYLPYYAAPDDPIHVDTDAAIVDRSVEALAAMMPDFGAARVVASSVGRARFVLPLSTVGYSSRLPAMRTSIPGVWIINSAHIVNGTLNVDETIQLADRGVGALLADEDARVAR